jgi:hypothetical protein
MVYTEIVYNRGKEWQIIKYKDHEDGRGHMKDTDKFCVYASEHNIYTYIHAHTHI